MNDTSQSDAAVETKKTEQPRKQEKATRRDKKPRRGGKGIAILALLIALIACAGAAALWYWGQQRLVAVSSHVDAVKSQVQSDINGSLKPDIKALQSGQSKLDKQADRHKQSLDSLHSDMDRTRGQLRGLSKKVQGGQQRWQLEDVQSLLLAANRRLQLGHAPHDAQKALQLANKRLGSLNDPRLFRIRKLVVDDIARINALPDPDIEGLSLTLSSLIKQAPDLPQITHVPGNYLGNDSGQQATGKANDGWTHFLSSVGQALQGMLTIRRTDSGLRPLLPPKQTWFLYQNLLLKLQTARLALLSRDTTTYSDSLKSAEQWLKTYFDTSDSAVSGAISRIGRMRKVQLSWQPPDITDSLVALRKYMRGDDAPQASAGKNKPSGKSKTSGQKTPSKSGGDDRSKQHPDADSSTHGTSSKADGNGHIDQQPASGASARDSV